MFVCNCHVLRLVRKQSVHYGIHHGIAMELLQLFSSPFALLLTTLILIGIVKFVPKVNRAYFYWKKKGIPYLPDSWSSFLISLKVFKGRFGLVNSSHYLYNYFPDAKYVGVADFARPNLLVRDPELIKDITVKDFDYFPDHRTLFDEKIEPLFGKNTFFLRGDRWKEMRNTLSPSFTASKMKFMFELMSKCSSDFVDYLIEHPEICLAMETKQVFRRYTNDVIATTAFGISVNSMKEQNNEFYTRGVEATTFSNGVLGVIKFMLIQFFPRFAKSIGVSFFPPATLKFFREIVGETIKTREENGIVRPDMIHMLMQARDKKHSHQLTLDDIVSQAFSFFFAGFDTSSTLMCFVAHELAVNQDIQDRLREEVERHLADENNDTITYESLSKMVYMDMVISEALRKYPPVLFMDRLCVKNYELPPSQPGYKSVTIESDTILTIPVYSLQHDPKYFPNPQKFDPERFSDKNKDNIVPCTYLPFGHGPRKCLGNRFVLMETKLLIAHLLRKFILKTTEKTVEPMVFDKKEMMTLKPAGGFWIGLEKRQT